jgi:hypothetical protein
MTKQINKTSSFFKHILWGRGANNTHKKSLKSSLFSKTSGLTLFIFLYYTSTAQSQYQQSYNGNNPPRQIQMGGNAQTIMNQQINAHAQPNRANQLAEINEIISEDRRRQPAQRLPTQNQNYVAKDFEAQQETYTNSLNQLKQLLTSDDKQSLAKAYYILESAYGNTYLNQKEYNNIINKSASFIKLWMKQNNYDANDNQAKHLAIQKFMSEKLTVTNSTVNKEVGTTIKSSQHLPFFYDYNDFEAKQDYRNFFLSKCLATGGGQCNSMPQVYLVLAEALGAKAYLSFAPQHSFIKYPNANGEVINYEATTNWQISDQWYRDNMFISNQAIKSGIYIDTFNQKQIVANIILDLAVSFMYKNGMGDGAFVKQCLLTATPLFPKNNNIYAYFIYAEYLKATLNNFLKANNLSNPQQLKNYPEQYKLLQEYNDNEKQITNLGFQDMPEGMYEQMMKESEFKRNVQNSYNITGKEKRNLFIETK